jgi:uncharacterized delta-60 repeat protein
MTAPSVTTTEAGAMVIAAYSSGVDFSSAPTAGNSMTLRGYDMSTSNGAASRTGSALQDEVQSVVGASGTKTMTQPTSAANIGHTIALKPAPIVSQSGYRWFENNPILAAQSWGGTGNDIANALALDSAGNIYVAGYTDSSGLTAGLSDQTLVKYNSAGVEQWSKTWGGTGSDIARALALDSAGNIYVAGYTSSSGLTAGGSDQTLVKYNSAGVEQWSKTWGGTGFDRANALALDSAGNIYVAGYTSSPGLTAGGVDQTLVKFDTTGNIDNCSYCVDRTTTEVDRTTTEVDRTTTEVDRTTTEVDRTTTEVDRTGLATITTICGGATLDVTAPLNSVAQNTPTTAPAEQQLFRLRLTLHAAESALSPGYYILKLQYAPMSGTCDIGFSGETYADVTASTPIAFADNPAATDGVPFAANANDPTHSGHTNIIQEYNEANPTDVTATIPAGQDGLWDFALKDNGAPANTSYCFRLVKSDGALLDAYSVIPQITTQVPTFEQSGYRWFENQDATGGVATFAKTYSSSSSVSFRKTARDASGNMYVAGGIKDDLFSNSDMLLIKYDASGIEQWSRRWGFAGSSVLLTVGVDGLGNIYVAGITNAGSSANDYQSLIKFNSSGDLLWNVFWGADGNDAAYDLAFDASNNIYVVGAYITGGSTQQSVSKFTPSGTNSWDRIWGGDSTDIARGVALDSSGNIYVVGETASTGLTAGSVDQTLVKYDSSGTLQWSKTWGGDGDDRANGVALDSSGNIYVVGETASTGFTVGSSDQTLVKYNPSGIEQWSKTWGGDGSDQANTLALDSSGNIYVVGETNSSGLTGGGDDQTLVKYSSSGVEQWSKTWGGSTPDSAGSVVVDGVGGIYVVGYNNILSGVGTLLRLNVSGEIPGCSYCVDRTVSEVDRAVAEVDRPSATATELLDTLWVPAPKIPTNISGTITTTVLCENVGSSISTSVPLNAVAQNTATTAPSSGTIFRLRTLLHGANKPVGSAYGPLKLQYAAMSGTCDAGFSGETYADVTASTAIAYADNPVATDGLALAAGPNDPSHSGHTNVLQEYNEANNTGVLTTIPVGQDGLWDFALKDNGGTAGTSYCLRIVKSDNTLLNAYSFIPQITIAVSGTLSIGFVDGSGAPVATPTFSLGAINRLGTFQTATGTFGDATRKLRVFNSLATNGWSVTLAPTGGATAAWNRTDNLAKYDYNDSGTNATDSAIDADSLGGQMSINPSAGTIASTCSLTGLSKGASGSYVEGTTNSLTLMSATSAAAMSCNWDFTGAPFTQTIPAAQSSGTYTMDMTATVVSL